MMKLRVALLALPLAASLPAAARADDTVVFNDVVHLRNGGLYRGHVTEVLPGDHVTVLVERGERTRIPWSDVGRVVIGSGAAGAPSAGTASAPEPSTPPMRGPRARVHLVASKVVILYRRPAGTTGWVQACTSPCDVDLPIGDSYRVQGNSVHPSDELRLAAKENDTVTLDIETSSSGGQALGIIIATAGALTAYAGLGVAAGDRSDESTRAGGLVALAIGIGAVVGGVLIFRAARATDVLQSQGNAVASGGHVLDAFRREPTWASTSQLGRGSEHGWPKATVPVLLERSF